MTRSIRRPPGARSGRRLRVGYVVAALDAAGSERQMLALAERLPADRFEPEFLLLTRPGVNAPRAAAAGLPAVVVPPAIRQGDPPAVALAGRVVHKAANFIRLVRERHYDIVDAWLFHAYLLTALARPLARPSIVVTGRRSLISREASGRVGRLLRRFAAAMSDVVVANSPQVRERVIEDERLDPRKVRLIRNGVVIPSLPDEATRLEIRAELGLPTDVTAIGSVANFLPGKGHEILIEAAASVRQRHPSARFVLIGEGHLRAQLERQALEYGVRDRVVFTGSVPDATRLMPALDLYVQPSLGEGLPNATLEAAAAGKPIVATSVGGTPEIVRDGVTGTLVRAGDAIALAAAVAGLLDDPGRAAALGQAARAFAAATFGMDRFVAEFADLYLELAERRGIGR